MPGMQEATDKAMEGALGDPIGVGSVVRRVVPRGDAALVIAVLRNVGWGVTRLLLSCYAKLLEYLYRVIKPRE